MTFGKKKMPAVYSTVDPAALEMCQGVLRLEPPPNQRKSPTRLDAAYIPKGYFHRWGFCFKFFGGGGGGGSRFDTACLL